MVDLLRQVMPVCGLREAEWPDSCNLNWYINGEDSVGWHADDESLFRGTAQNMSDPYSYTSHKGLKLLPRPGTVMPVTRRMCDVKGVMGS